MPQARKVSKIEKTQVVFSGISNAIGSISCAQRFRLTVSLSDVTVTETIIYYNNELIEIEDSSLVELKKERGMLQ